MICRPIRTPILAAAVAVAMAAVPFLAPPPAPAAAAVAAQQAKTYEVDPVHTAAVFRIQWNGLSPFYGQFTDFKGSLTYAGSPETFACDVAVPVRSIDTHNEQRKSHLMSPEYFNEREYPEIRFKSSGVTANGDGTHTLAGDLTLRGVTRPVEATLRSVEAGSTPRGDRVGADLELTIVRSEFGMTAGVEEGALGDEVTLMIGLQGVMK